MAADGADAEVLDERDGPVLRLLAVPAAPLAMTRASFNALGAAAGHAEVAWADPDLLWWSQREPESRDAAIGHLERLRDERG